MIRDAKTPMTLLVIASSFVLCPTTCVFAASKNAERLLKLAEEEGITLTDAEQKLFEAVGKGAIADFRSERSEDNDPGKAAEWVETRVLRANRIERLFSPKLALLVTRNGIRITGARIDGRLFLFNVNVSFGVRLEGCAIAEGLSLQSADIERLSLAGTQVGSITADGLKTRGTVSLTNSFKSAGEVRMGGATIGADFDCSGGHFDDPVNALNINGASIKGNFFLRYGFSAKGWVTAFGATIDGGLIWTNSPDSVIDLRYLKLGALHDKTESWPAKGNLLIDGLVYDHIGDHAPVDAELRKAWLALQPDDRFHPQPYEHLARVLRNSGRVDGAREILVEKERIRLRQSQVSLGERIFWYWTFGRLIGYGHYPLRAFWPMFAVVLLGTLFFGLGACGDAGTRIMTPTDKEGYPQLNYLVYSLDSFVPLIDLHQVKYWLPSASRGRDLFRLGGYTLRTGALLRAYHWLHTIFGWTLSVLLAAALTGLIRG